MERLSLFMKEELSDIYFFNPTCEYAIANGRSSWQPNRLLQKMEEDLCELPMFFANENDTIIVRKMPTEELCQNLMDVGVSVPRFILMKDIIKNVDFFKKSKNKLIPWGWSPVVHKLLEPFKSNCSEEFKKSPVAMWNPMLREITSRKFAFTILGEVMYKLPKEITITEDLLPKICRNRKDLEEVIKKWKNIIVKAPWSCSGRGLQKITKRPVNEKVWEKLLGIIKDQGYAMAEPYLNKKLDMAFQFEVIKGEIKYLGISRFFTDKKGQYQGNYLNKWPDKLKEKNEILYDFVHRLPKILVPILIDTLENSLLTEYYWGNFGVDILIFKDESGRIKVNPCLEINVRQNMGLLALKLEKIIAPDKMGVFKIYYKKGVKFIDFVKEKSKIYPVCIENKKVKSGLLPIISVSENTQFGAYVIVDEKK